MSIHVTQGTTPNTSVLAKLLQNRAEFIQKIDPWFQKSHKGFGQVHTSSGKSKKLKFDGLLLSKKIHSFS